LTVKTATINRVKVPNGAKIFYREAGDKSKPTFLLLHGFPTSSFMYRNLIPLLAPHFHVIAPDLPGFGFTEVPDKFEYSFDSLAATIQEFVDVLKITKFSVYIFDYGAPVGLRLALNKPSQITSIVTQNGNAYDEGLVDTFWGPLKQYWGTDQTNPDFVKAFTGFLSDPKNIVDQYRNGFTNPDAVDPAPAKLDEFLFTRPGAIDVQIKLFHDYRSNVALYPKFHEYFKSSNVPILVAWGKNDYIFPVEGAEAFKRDSKNVTLALVNSGHFALEEFVDDIANSIIEFASKL